MFIETFQNMPVGMKFNKLDTLGEFVWSGEIILENGVKKIVIEDSKNIAIGLDYSSSKKMNIYVRNEDTLRQMGYNLNDIERLGKADYKYDINSILCKNTLNLPVKTKFKYVDCSNEIEVVLIDRVKKLWNNSYNCEEEVIPYSNISILNYEKLYLYGYTRKAIEYLCDSVNVIKVATFDKPSPKDKLFGRYAGVTVKELTIEDRIYLAEDVLKNEKVKYDECYNRFTWKDLGDTFSFYDIYIRISLVSNKKPWTIDKDNNGFECIKYFDNYDVSLGYIDMHSI